MTSAVSGLGTLLNWGGVDLAELTNISGPTQSVKIIDVTSHSSADSYAEFLLGIRDGGEISLEGNFISTDSTGQIAMHTDFQSGSLETWIIKFPAWVESSHEYPQITGSGYVTSFEMAYPFDDKISFKATIKVSGKPILAVS